jgi:hypothetical protein
MGHEENRLTSGVSAFEGEDETESVNMLDLSVLVPALLVSNGPLVCGLLCQYGKAYTRGNICSSNFWNFTTGSNASSYGSVA